MIRFYIPFLTACLTLVMVACGTSHKLSDKVSEQSAVEEKDPLTYEERRKFDYYFLEAVRMKQKGDYDAAFELYTHCLDIYPESPAALYEISNFYQFLGLEAKSEECLKKAVRMDDSNFWYKQTLAGYYQNKRDWAKAIAVYEDMATLFPSRLEPLLSLVSLYNQTKSYQDVVKTLDRLELLDGKSEQISMEKFRMYLTLNNQEQAFAEIKNLVDEYPYEMRYRTLLGDLYMTNNKPDEAYATYREILNETPDYAPALLSLTSYYQKIGNDSLYRKSLDTILLNDNVETDTKMDIMRQLIMQNEQTTQDSTQIIALFKEILKRPQPNADLPMLCGQYLYSKRMEKESIPVFKLVLALDPENKPARLLLLSYAIRENDLDEVIRVATPAMQYSPEVLEFYYYLGLAYYQKDNEKKALEVLERGQRQIDDKVEKPLASDYYAIMGDLYHTANQYDKSYAAYDSSLVYNPNNINTLNNYAYFLSVEGKQLDKAEEMSYQTVKAEPDNATYLDTYSWILFEKGKYTEARIYIEQALKNGGDTSQVILEHCGDIYYKLGKKKEAVEYWKKADAVKPDADENSSPRSEKELQRLKRKIRLQKYIAE